MAKETPPANEAWLAQGVSDSPYKEAMKRVQELEREVEYLKAKAETLEHDLKEEYGRQRRRNRQTSRKED